MDLFVGYATGKPSDQTGAQPVSIVEIEQVFFC